MTQMEDQQFQMRAPCERCGSSTGRIDRRGEQNCVFCHWCGTFAYNAPRTETGERKRSVTTVHAGVKPRQRALMVLRSGGHCELCGDRAPLHVGHLISAEDGLTQGLTDAEINHEANLVMMCEQCNLGLGHLSVTARMLTALALRIQVRRATG